MCSKKSQLMDIQKQDIKATIYSSLQIYTTMVRANVNLTPKAIMQAR